MSQISEYQTFLEIATEAALTAGDILDRYYNNLQHIEEKTRPGDLVTEADQASEKAILALLHKHLPNHYILAEESGNSGDRQSEYTWMIDPLDGTTNYAHGYPVFAVSIALAIAGVPQVGVIYNPYRKELFQAAIGLGATLNQKPIHVSQTDQLINSILATGFAYDRRETTDNNYPEFCYLTHSTQGVRRAGAASLDLADVACGRLDGYWERGLQPWDIAAGIVLIQEAGGTITAYDQTPINIPSGRILTSNSKIHKQLSQALQEASSWFYATMKLCESTQSSSQNS